MGNYVTSGQELLIRGLMKNRAYEIVYFQNSCSFQF